MTQVFQNRLTGETSPYLLQHANNPVDWYPWGDEAILRARDENKPILLSIGYAACHWCHVMEHESFEDPETARLMNDLFVCIKVDREERPDIDQIYMNFVQITTGSGGWPLNVFLTPDLEPFFGGTYFPPQDRYGRISWKKVLSTVSEFYHNRKSELNQNLKLIREAFSKNAETVTGAEIPDRPVFTSAVRSLAQMYDPKYGGLGTAPKFPPVQPLNLFLRHFHNTRNPDYLAMVTLSLRKMAEGGIYDQLAGGFARYSVDEKWLVPHFEKMLYDNALLVPLYLDVYLITKEKFFLDIAKDVLNFTDREMRADNGGFYSSLDADSEGIEGKFYVWSKKEIDEILAQDSPLFCDYYDVTESGNFEHINILHIQSNPAQTGARFKKTAAEVERIMQQCRQKLLSIRGNRVHPDLDDKIITSWNALMITAFARAYQITNIPRYEEIIRQAIHFLNSELVSAEGLLRTHNKGQARYAAYIEDYSFLIQALLDAYEALAEESYLQWAENLMQETELKFWDEKNPGYFVADQNQKHLIYRLKSDHDQSIPSGSAVMLMNHLRFYTLTGKEFHIQRAEALLKKYGPVMSGNPYAYASYLCALDFYLAKPKEIVIVQPADQTPQLTREIFQIYLPNRVLAQFTPDAKPAILSAALYEGKTALNGSPTAYICHNFACFPPVNSIAEIKNLLQS